jgi:predicted nucleic acid-binding protein
VAGVTLDAGALIGYERGDDRVRAWLEEAFDRASVPTVPSVVVVQTWRGASSARIARLLKVCQVEVLDDALAREAGALLGRSATSDVADAVVVASAARRRDVVLTSDPDDISVLAAMCEGVGVRAL